MTSPHRRTASSAPGRSHPYRGRTVCRRRRNCDIHYIRTTTIIFSDNQVEVAAYKIQRCLAELEVEDQSQRIQIDTRDFQKPNKHLAASYHKLTSGSAGRNRQNARSHQD